MVALGLDIGEVRVGIAVSDRLGRVATPLKVLPAHEVQQLARPFRRILEDYEPEVLVCGLPRSLSGELGPQAETVTQFAEALGENCGLPVMFVDERLSSAEAKRTLRAQGLSERDMRGRVDMLAASLFLQTWLEMQLTRGDAND